jgi:ubiquinone/menaquinone biosynthesis C-methylase UbiE
MKPEKTFTQTKWPKILAELTPEKKLINDDFMQYWHQELAKNTFFYRLLENFNHTYVTKHISSDFSTTLEIGAGLGEHLKYEKLSTQQKSNYVALELRANMAEEIKKKYPEVITLVADCQTKLNYPDNYFDRILAISCHSRNIPFMQ